MTLYNTELMSLQYISPGCKYAHFYNWCNLLLYFTSCNHIDSFIAIVNCLTTHALLCSFTDTQYLPPICYPSSHVLIVFLPLWSAGVASIWCKFVFFVSMVFIFYLHLVVSKTHFLFFFCCCFLGRSIKYSFLSMEALPVSHGAGKGRMHRQ